jgi:hypothetical protein
LQRRVETMCLPLERLLKLFEIVSPQVALPLFNQVIDSEESLQTTVNFDPIYRMAKEHIFKDNTKASVEGGRKQDALNQG